MQKVYLLLRNNQQTGPYTLDELIQLGLKPLDLIWVEGKSFGWSYPSEIETLKPFAPDAPQKTDSLPFAAEATSSPAIKQSVVPKNIFVSLPGSAIQAPVPASTYDPIEQKAEELRKRAQAYSVQGLFQPEELKTNYTRSLNEVEENYTSWLYEKKIKKKATFPTAQVKTIGLIGVGLLGLWWIGKTVFSTSAERTTRVATYGDVKTGAGPVETEEAQPVKLNPPEKNPLKYTTARTTLKKVKASSRSHKIQSSSESTGAASVPVVTVTEPVPSPQEPITTVSDKKEPAAAEPSKTKKKTLKDILGGLFKKKKEEPAQQEPQPAGTNGNERNATRREDATAPTTVNIADQVDIRMNKNSEDWMMGVQGLKLTLYNRSTVMLNKAVVEVLYYSEQNSLLEKKTLYFSSIAPQKSQTVAAPDHRMADHVEYRVVSAVGE